MRGARPFVHVDCAALSEALFESELFGHERGAFTGAIATRTGRAEAAGEGTLFLDEVGELAPRLQAKLLRLLQERRFERVGGETARPFRARVVAATNLDLVAAARSGTFRRDLLFRLDVARILLPPLRERREDLPLLVDHLLESLGFAERREAARMRSPELAAEMARHAWPGNVRELRNYVERVVALDEPVELAKPGAPAAQNRPFREARDALLSDFERTYVAALLEAHAGNVSAAARAAGLDRLTFYRMLWRHGMR